MTVDRRKIPVSPKASSSLFSKAETWAKNSWTSEVAAILLSLGLSTSIGVVLGVYDGKPAPSLSIGITFNAIISILSTASKATLIYTISSCLSQTKWIWFKNNKARRLLDAQLLEDASRGPLGALRILTGSKAVSLASLGTILTLLMLAVDPFVQQIIIYPTRELYAASDLAFTEQARLFVNHPWELSSVQSIHAGLWGDDTQSQRTPHCPTGNCTWPPFESISWCTECHDDVTWSFQDPCEFSFDPATVPNGTWVNRDCTLISSKGYAQTVFVSATLSGVDDSSLYRVAVPYLRIAPLHAVVDGHVENDLPSPTMNASFPMASFGIFNFSNDTTLHLNKAEVCTMDLCLPTYSINVINAKTVSHTMNIQGGTWNDQNLTYEGQVTTDTTTDSWPFTCWVSRW